jgi:hypothetical protein
MAVPFSANTIVRLNRVTFLDVDISMQLLGPIGINFSITIILQGFTLPPESQSACIIVSVILQ